MSDLQTLPNDGRTYLVTTEHSSYVIDTGLRVLQRHRGAEAPYALRVDLNVTPYDSLTCEVGEPLAMDNHDGYWLRSTPVVGIDVWGSE